MTRKTQMRRKQALGSEGEKIKGKNTDKKKRSAQETQADKKDEEEKSERMSW